jgi:hypothetical protein
MVGVREQWNELRLRGKLMDRVVVVFDEIPLHTPEVGALEYLCQLAQWEENIATLAITPEDPYDNSERSRKYDHTQIGVDTYWKTLLGGWVDTDEGPITRETYYEFCINSREARDVVVKYITPERYVMLTLNQPRLNICC